MSKKRGHGEGTIDARGENSWRLRYRVNGKRFAVTVHGTLSDARRRLRELLLSGDNGTHVAPARITFRAWTTEWLALRQRKISAKTAEHYSELLPVHVLPALGERPLQTIDIADIDALYNDLSQRLSARSVHHIHVILKSCLATAVLKRRLADNPVARADAPQTKDSDAWNVLDEMQLNALVCGFKRTSLYLFVAVAAFTGMRRNEMLALRWTDVDFGKSIIKVYRSLEETKRLGHPRDRTVKEPKTERGKRTISIDAVLLDLLRVEHERHLRLMTGVPDRADVSLTLMRLPAEALVFPSPMLPFDFTRFRNPTSTTKEFMRHAAKLGFPIRLHDLRHSHGTILLNKGVPIHEVAGRLGHDPAVLLRTYAHRLPKVDERTAEIIGGMTKGVL